MTRDQQYALAERAKFMTRKWFDRADEIERQVSEYDPSEKDLPEVHMLELVAETLRECAADLLGLEEQSAEEEIKF